MRRATYVGQRLRKFSLFGLNGGDRGSMTRDWSVTQPAHRPSVSRQSSSRIDRQPIFSKWPQPFSPSTLLLDLSFVLRGSRLPLFFRLPFVLRFFARRQCAHLQPSVSFFLQFHPNAWSCSYEKSYDHLWPSQRISSRRISLLRVVLRRCVTTSGSSRQSFREKMHPLLSWHPQSETCDQRRMNFAWRQTRKFHVTPCRHRRWRAFHRQAWRPDPRRDSDLLRRNRIRNHARSKRP